MIIIIVDTTARVMLDEREMPEAMQGVAIPLDPGEHSLRALYGDVIAAEDIFSAREGETTTHMFEVPAPIADLTVRGLDEETEPTFQEDHTTRRRVLGTTLGIVAAVGVAVLLAILLKPGAPDPTQTDLPPIVFE